MRARDVITETWSALDANRGRNALTILGIVIGIAAVIAMTALIGGINQALVSELGLNEARLVHISVWADRPIEYGDVEALQRDVKGYEYVTGISWGGAEVTTGEKRGQKEKKVNANVIGAKPEYFSATNTKFVQGARFTEAEDLLKSLVVVIDQTSVKTLFGDAKEDVIGRSIYVDKEAYVIVGVIESEQVAYDESVNLVMPFSTAAEKIVRDESVSEMLGVTKEDVKTDKVIVQTERYLASMYQFDAQELENYVYVWSMQSAIDQLDTTIGSFRALMTAVASISLLVGGIGIMNMMLTNVSDRILEIGLRKSLGAKEADITRQFLLESVFLCALGGLIGVVVGLLGALSLSGFASDMLYESGETLQNVTIVPVVDVDTLVTAVVICVSIGVVFGWYPARRAAKLNPIESLYHQ